MKHTLRRRPLSYETKKRYYAYGFIATLVVNVVGACLFIWLGRRLFG